MLQYHAFDRFTTHLASAAESVAVPVAAGILGVAGKAMPSMVRSGDLPCVRSGNSMLLQRNVLNAVTRGETA